MVEVVTAMLEDKERDETVDTDDVKDDEADKDVSGTWRGRSEGTLVLKIVSSLVDIKGGINVGFIVSESVEPKDGGVGV